MNIIELSKKEYRNLKPFNVSSSILHTESDLYELDYHGKRKIVKTMFTYDKDFHFEKLRTLETLDTFKYYLPESFLIPDSIISVRRKKEAFTIPYFEGETLNSLLKNHNIPIQTHLYYLKRVG